MSPVIKPLESDDYDQWLPLWVANNQGRVAPAITKATWGRLMDPAGQVYGLGARVNGRLLGLVHGIIHPVTGNLQPACYMQDLFVDPAARRQGLGRALVLAMADHARAQKYARLYWLAETGNLPAQTLYEGLGVKLDFTFHVMPL